MAPDQLMAMTLQVGQGPYRQRSPIPARRITQLQAIDSSGAAQDLRGRLRLGEPAADGDFRLSAPGVYTLVLVTDNRAQTHLPAIRFNDYLRVEGLTPALKLRALAGKTESDGSQRIADVQSRLCKWGQ